MKLNRKMNVYLRDTHPELPIDPDVVRPGEYKWPPHFTPSLLSAVFIGGCAGAYARYGVIVLWPSEGSTFPFTTLFVNLLGAFLLGILLEGLTRRGSDTGGRRIARLLIGTGFMGAFTTYSTFAVETTQLARHSSLNTAALYAVTSIFGGLILCAIGIKIAAVHHKKRTNI